uniref:Cell division coordinator CpoB n=1 Tax=Candidatus Kentrum sp. FW TaxID=2126338 RepID=A0A450TIX0_9GAMM|nr:MAG: tol-pal system protein YbgF [Candidatus Kentron sp. FW]VFJ67269.1 MAG: tol-pal system protein YbgF [Candidatus Kentron sp. FW]
MRTLSTLRLTAVFLCVLPLSGVSAGQIGSGTIQERLDHVERVIGNRALMDLLDRIDNLQQEVRELRGQIEVQGHALSRVKQSQRNYYLDLDKRLQQLEGGKAGSKTVVPRTFSPYGTETPLTPGSDATGMREALRQPASRQTAGYEPTDFQPEVADAGPGQGEDGDYQAAFDLLRKKAYARAIASLKRFLEQYPHSRYVEDAQYWLGEAYYITRQFEPALDTFRKLPREYPNSPKISDALLKIGYVQDELNQKAEAEQTLTNLIEQYPTSTQAHLAKKRLQKIRGKAP